MEAENPYELKNHAKGMDDKELMELAVEVIDRTEDDRNSRSEWEELYLDSIKMHANKRDEKTEPFKNCSNTGFPDLAKHALQFKANASSNLIPPKDFFKADPLLRSEDARDAADRKAKYLNATLFRDKSYIKELKAMLPSLFIQGTVIRKVSRDEKVRVDNVAPVNFIINNRAKPFRISEYERYTHVIEETPLKISKKIKDGIYYVKEKKVKEDVTRPGGDNVVPEGDRYRDRVDEVIGYDEHLKSDDPTKPRTIYEQYIYKKFGNDQEPKQYIVTVDKEASQVLRIVENWNPVLKKKNVNFIDYHLFPALDGFYSFGFGLLIIPLIKNKNSLFNQFVDAGTIHNNSFKTGFAKSSSGLKKNKVEMTLNKYTAVNLGPDEKIDDMIYQLKFAPPSQSLMQAVKIIEEQMQALTTVTELKTGALPKSDTSATAVVRLLEESGKMFTDIHADIHDSLTREMEAIHDWVAWYLDPQDYFNIVGDEAEMINPDTGEQIDQASYIVTLSRDWIDYKGLALVSDSRITSKQDKVAKAEFVYQSVLQSPATNQNMQAISKAQENLMKEMGVEDDLLETIFQSQEPPNLSQEDENQMFISNKPVDALEEQDHQQHLQVIEEFEASEFYEALTPDGKKLLENHKRQHIGFLYKQQVQNQQNKEGEDIEQYDNVV